MAEDPLDFDARIAAADRLRRRDGVRGRYAPSPTGPLHLGNIRTALLSWLQVRLVGGVFILRMEDLDEPRSVEGSAEQILDDLRWLGLDWDEGPDVGGPAGPYTQSERKAIYREALERLHRDQRVFRCYCSRKDIAEASSAPHGRSPVYPGTCRHLTLEEEAQVQRAKGGKTPSWRFRVDARDLTVHDEIAGDYHQNLADDVGDFVVRRADELFAYQLAVVVDDLLMGVTDVLRGEDLLDSTPRQIALFEALTPDDGIGRLPRFWHVPLLYDADGQRMSKRDGSDSLAMLRASGATPTAVVGELAAGLGLVPPGTHLGAEELLERLDTSRFTDALRNARLSPPT